MLKMGILGFGKMGGFHAEWIAENKDLELKAVCDKSADRLEYAKEQFGVEVYNDAEEFLTKAEIDFVVIVTTNDVHEKFTVLALEKGKNVIVEKPMSMTYESTQRMIRSAEQTGNHLFVHQSSRWDRDFLLVKDTIESGLLGDILQVHSKVMLCDEGWPAWGIDGMENPWRIKAEYGGGILFDWGPHLVDQMLVLMGREPKGVFGCLQSGIWSKEVDDHFLAVLKYDENLVCQIEVSNNGRLTLPRWYVIGTMGTLEVAGFKEPFWDKAEIAYLNRKNGKRESISYTLHDVCESGAEGGFYPDLVSHVKGDLKSFVSMHEASSAIKVLEAIKKSHDTVQFVEL